MSNNKRELDGFEICPKCNGIYIQQDRITKKIDCLNCNHRWEMNILDINKVKNDYLRISMR